MINEINRDCVHLKPDRVSLAYRVISFLDRDAASRYVLTHRESGRVPIASSIYETHLAQKSDSQKTRSGSLYGIATLYSWADERGIDLDARLLSGEGLAPSQISAFSAWLRTRLGEGEKAKLTPESRTTHNQTLHFCRQTCVYFITQYATSASAVAERVLQIELLANSQSREWARVRIKTRKKRVAPDLTDEELVRIEEFLLPENRSRQVAQGIAWRDYLLWRLTIEFGLRIGEVLSLRLQDCPALGRNYISVVRIEERDDGVIDPRRTHAPRPKTLSRDLRFLWKETRLPQLIAQYTTRFRRASVKEHGRQVYRWVLPHPFLIVATNGNPLSISTANDVASAIKNATGINFHWHLARHAFFNRMYLRAKTNQELQDLVYWGGWESDRSLEIYSRRARSDRAKGVMRSENENWSWIALQ